MPALITAIRQAALLINRIFGYEKNMCVVEFVGESGNEQTIVLMVLEWEELALESLHSFLDQMT